MHRPFVSTYEGFKTLAHTPGSDTPQAQRDRANASAAEAWQRVAELEACLKECADELEGWVDGHYAPTKDNYPCEMRRYERDISPVHDARALLAKSK